MRKTRVGKHKPGIVAERFEKLLSESVWETACLQANEIK